MCRTELEDKEEGSAEEVAMATIRRLTDSPLELQPHSYVITMPFTEAHRALKESQ